MLTLNVSGKSGNDAVNFVRGVIAPDEDEAKILIDGPSQADGLTKFLKSQGFNDVILEDDEGLLYVTACRKEKEKKEPEHKPSPAPQTQAVPTKAKNEPVTSGVLISCDARKHKYSFLHKFLASIPDSAPKPEVVALMNSAVKLAAYTSPSCSILKQLESNGVSVLISESCADSLGITEAVGVGIMCQMSEILSKIFSCGKVVSI